MNIDLIPLIFLIIWIMLMEYLIIDLHYFNREMKLRKKLFYENIDNIEKIANFFAGQNNVKVKVEERIPCPVCDYPMRILEEHDDHYLCYCADCKRDRVIQKKMRRINNG